MMIRRLISIVLLLGITSSVGSAQSKGLHVVLPSHELVRLSGSARSGLWEEVPKDTEAVYPTQVTMEIRDTSVHVLVARYDKSVSIHDIQAAINARYGTWALAESHTTEQKLWRVIPEKLAISLDVGHGGMKEVYYFSIEGKSAGSVLPPDRPN
jgi:hypothetical protein